ncbi:hypothetical protein ACFCP7_00425 [Paenibacillus elgii]
MSGVNFSFIYLFSGEHALNLAPLRPLLLREPKVFTATNRAFFPLQEDEIKQVQRDQKDADQREKRQNDKDRK